MSCEWPRHTYAFSQNFSKYGMPPSRAAAAPRSCLDTQISSLCISFQPTHHPLIYPSTFHPMDPWTLPHELMIDLHLGILISSSMMSISIYPLMDIKAVPFPRDCEWSQDEDECSGISVTDFHGGSTSLHSHWQWMRLPLATSLSASVVICNNSHSDWSKMKFQSRLICIFLVSKDVE